MAGLGEFIARKRARKGLTQLQLATAASVDPSSLSRWERAEVAPGVEEYRRVLIALGIKPGPGLAEPVKSAPRKRPKKPRANPLAAS
jgi:transcriptional regulator with XRE-family HTH domain